MRPLTVLLGIIMGSSVSIALGLGMVLIVFLILMGERPELRAEFRPLMLGIVLFTVLSALSVAAFLGSIRQRLARRRRRPCSMRTTWRRLGRRAPSRSRTASPNRRTI